MATAPVYVATPKSYGPVLVATADTNSDGTTGTRATVATAGASGSRIDSVKIKGIVASGASQVADSVRLWLNNGTNSFLYTETLFAAGSAISATVANVEAVVALGINLPAGWVLQASTFAGGATASYHVTAHGGDY